VTVDRRRPRTRKHALASGKGLARFSRREARVTGAVARVDDHAAVSDTSELLPLCGALTDVRRTLTSFYHRSVASDNPMSNGRRS
jgi:hypothetical protein